MANPGQTLNHGCLVSETTYIKLYPNFYNVPKEK